MRNEKRNKKVNQSNSSTHQTRINHKSRNDTARQIQKNKSSSRNNSQVKKSSYKNSTELLQKTSQIFNLKKNLQSKNNLNNTDNKISGKVRFTNQFETERIIPTHNSNENSSQCNQSLEDVQEYKISLPKSIAKNSLSNRNVGQHVNKMMINKYISHPQRANTKKIASKFFSKEILEKQNPERFHQNSSANKKTYADTVRTQSNINLYRGNVIERKRSDLFDSNSAIKIRLSDDEDRTVLSQDNNCIGSDRSLEYIISQKTDKKYNSTKMSLNKGNPSRKECYISTERLSDVNSRDTSNHMEKYNNNLGTPSNNDKMYSLPHTKSSKVINYNNFYQPQESLGMYREDYGYEDEYKLNDHVKVDLYNEHKTKEYLEKIE